ncbi:MAG: MBL fold metallo-hydrolase [Alicyclobacillaceae bacterium]|jgi:glyoxylase-like metal-dependent hydrolase (beta-lactamase superfamily II)|uniref:MBL fold metallo-hydrolase n=1 Tax=Alicyclobacillus sp. SP_1 TaxID=2942475 RepID=UPI0021589C51|nr:MBL fold metallo-hydrolase [Alicyclobacillus sp. SP_1]MCY0888533.1 MBL fold metallo-hydrolase [Alicyclobacillaceae bacterium]
MPQIVTSEQVSLHVHRLELPTNTLPPAATTNAYLIAAHGQGLLVDAGTDDSTVIQHVLEHAQAVGVQHWLGVIATHYHTDHTDGLLKLADTVSAPAYLHPRDFPAYLREHAERPLPWTALLREFIVNDLRVDIVDAPGHTHGHIHVAIPSDRVVLVGDSLTAAGTVWIGAPDGHMDAYYATLDDLATRTDWKAAPGHGQMLANAAEAALRMKQRRLQRETQILHMATTETPVSMTEMLERLYPDLPEAAVPFARRTLLAHAEHLEQQGLLERIYMGSPLQYHFLKAVNPQT